MMPSRLHVIERKLVSSLNTSETSVHKRCISVKKGIYTSVHLRPSWTQRKGRHRQTTREPNTMLFLLRILDLK